MRQESQVKTRIENVNKIATLCSFKTKTQKEDKETLVF